MEIRSLRHIVLLCALCSIQVTSVYSQSTTEVSTASPPEQTTLSPDTTNAAQTDIAGTGIPQTDTAGADTPQTDTAPTTTEAASADASTATSNTDTEQQTTETAPTQTDSSSDGTAAPTGTVETTPGDSIDTSTDGQTGVPYNSTEGSTTQSAVTTGNDTQTTTVIQTNDTVTTEGLDGSTPTVDNSTSTQAPEGTTTPTDGGDNSTDSSFTTSAQTSVSTSPPTPGPTTQAQPATEYPPVEADTDIATFTLQLKFNMPVSCNGSYLREELDKSLQGTSGYRGVKPVDETQLNASYSAKSLVERDSNSVKTELTSALDVSNECYKFNETGLNDVISEFAAQTRDYCSARYLCPLGYNCQEGVEGPVCVSVCEGSDCQNGGQCDVVINKQEATAEARCRCVDTIGTVYSGEKCEESRMNPERVAAIVGGVLGGVCLILLIALYCTCYKKRENSGKKYHLSGVYNETYDHASLDMKNM